MPAPVDITEARREVKQWENGLKKYDLTDDFKNKNAEMLKGFG